MNKTTKNILLIGGAVALVYSIFRKPKSFGSAMKSGNNKSTTINCEELKKEIESQTFSLMTTRFANSEAAAEANKYISNLKATFENNCPTSKV